MADIEAIIADAREFAADTYTSALDAVGSAVSTINGISSTAVSVDLPTIGLPAAFVPAPSPALVAVGFVLPDKPPGPEAPAPIPDPIADLGTQPALSVTVPVIDLDSIQRPSQLGDFTTPAPLITTSFDMPEAPELITPAVPVVVDREAPLKPDVLLPTFDALKPADVGAAPTDYAERFTAAYREAAPSMIAALDGQIDAMLARFNPQFHTQMAAIESKLSQYLAGGTALTPAVENAIYERTRDKTGSEYRRTRDTVMEDAAKRGFTMPGGAVLSAVQQARQAGADNNARAAIDIAVKMAELEQQNMQFAVTTSTNLRTAVMSAALSFHSNLISLNGQSLSYAQSILSAMIEVYNTQVRAFQARLEGYRTEASVFETKLRGALANIELYKAEIDALQAMTQVDVAKVGIYREQIAGQTALVQMYRTRVDAVVSQASLEKMKLELFSEQVRAYSVQTQAKSAEWQAYSAAVGGEEAKARVYATQVQAYQAEWSGYSAKVNAKSEQIRAVAVSNQAKAQYASAQMEAFNSEVAAEARRVEAEVSYQAQLLQEYSIANQAAVAAANASVESYKARNQVTIASADLASRAMIDTARLALERAKAVAETSVSASNVYGNIAGAALSGMNTLVTQSA